EDKAAESRWSPRWSIQVRASSSSSSSSAPSTRCRISISTAQRKLRPDARASSSFLASSRQEIAEKEETEREEDGEAAKRASVRRLRRRAWPRNDGSGDSRSAARGGGETSPTKMMFG
ncbi:hypothetical protein X777_02585, partial [Ooceraea biroi]